MSSEAIDLIPIEEKQIERLGAGLPVTRQDLESMRERISLLKEFVRTQMVRDVDYGIIPGTPKPTLYQPGAQKLARLFGLTAKKECVHREVDRKENFSMFSYRADIFHARSAQLIAQCEGSCNSQERKYASRRVKGALEETAICDIVNTLQKMAQKRAFVGGIIEATGASDFFSQDIDSPEEAAQAGLKAPPSTATVSVPHATSASSRDQSDVEFCGCGKPMMISKFNESEWYCNAKNGGCGAKKPR